MSRTCPSVWEKIARGFLTHLNANQRHRGYDDITIANFLLPQVLFFFFIQAAALLCVYVCVRARMLARARGSGGKELLSPCNSECEGTQYPSL